MLLRAEMSQLRAATSSVDDVNMILLYYKVLLLNAYFPSNIWIRFIDAHGVGGEEVQLMTPKQIFKKLVNKNA
jgi:hypothetical protein